MKMKRKKKRNRILSFLLVILLVLGEPSTLQVLAAELSQLEISIPGLNTGKAAAVSGGDAAGNQEGGPGEDSPDMEGKEEGAQEEPGDTELADSVSGNLGNTVSGNIPPRQPEQFYEDPSGENFGTLVAYDAYSRTYHVEGKSYVTVIGNDGSTYLDEEGVLRQVDNRLVENPMRRMSAMGAGTSYVNGANDFQVSLQESVTVSGGDLLTLTDGEHQMSAAPVEGSFTEGVVQENAIRYNNVFPHVDFQYTVLGSSVKEDILLLSREARNSFSYELRTNGLQTTLLYNTLFLHEEGADPEKEAVFVLEAPEMEDAAGEISFGVRLDLEHTDEGCVVTVTGDSQWLQAPERVYPVRLDPTAIQVPKSAIHVACAEEGSPNTVIGDNSYPYVGYDDGITSGNLAGYGSKHLNCRSYFQIDYDFASLAEEPEIVSAAFQVTQKTRWSKGASEFGLFGVEEPWEVGSLTWNSQLGYNHYFLDSQNAVVERGQPLSFDVTEEVSSWINGTSQNHGFVMKAMVEAPGEAAGDAGVSMQCEVFYNNSSASYAPKLIVSWTGELTDLSSLTLEDTTIDIYPVVERNGDKSNNTLGVAAHGLAKLGSTVHYSLVNGSTGKTEARTSLVYPDSGEYKDSFPTALDYKRRLSNWQSQVFSDLTPGQVYYIEAYAEGTINDDELYDETGAPIPGVEPIYGTGPVVRSDSFLIYVESAFDLLPRIVNHYRAELDTVMADMRMQDCLTKEGNRIFLRNPQNTAAYSSGELDAYYQAVIDGLLLGRAENCVFGFEPVNLNTGNFYMEQQDALLSEIGGDFGITRQYNSLGAAYKGSMGYGWNFAYDERLGELSDGSVLWLQSSGGILTFAKSGEGYLAPAGQDYVLEETQEGWTVTDLADGSRHLFNAYGLLTAVEDVQGNRTALTYDVDFHLKSITTPSGKIFGVTLDQEERIAGITQPDGYGITYAYDEAGNLTTVTDQAGYVRRYEYDAGHRMTAWYDENGNPVIENEYDEKGRVTRQTDAEGGVVTLSYEQNEAGGITTATDAEGNVTVYHYDGSYRTTLVEYPDGTREETGYNSAGYRERFTDRDGAVFTYTYNERGKLLTETRQDGGVRSYTYNAILQR